MKKAVLVILLAGILTAGVSCSDKETANLNVTQSIPTENPSVTKEAGITDDGRVESADDGRVDIADITPSMVSGEETGTTGTQDVTAVPVPSEIPSVTEAPSATEVPYISEVPTATPIIADKGSDSGKGNGNEDDKAGKREDSENGSGDADSDGKEAGNGEEAGNEIGAGDGKEAGNGATAGDGKEAGNGAIAGDGKEAGNGATAGDGKEAGNGATAGDEKEVGDGEEKENGVTTISWNTSWKYAENSMIHEDSVKLYKSSATNRKNVTVAVNAGHGTKGGSNVKTLCHPDGTPKVTGGSTAEGAIKATAVSYGSSTLSGTPEAEINLKLAITLKELLLEAGYDVLMIRESSDAQLDNIARTVFANNNADCHIALHFDSTETDKGFFFIGPPDISSYKKMEPVASHWQEHNALGKAVVEGEKDAGVKIFGNGSMGMDLTQISYSTVPSIDVEVGDRASDYSQGSLTKIADGIVKGLDIYFER